MLILQVPWEGIGNESQECRKTRQLTDQLRKRIECALGQPSFHETVRHLHSRHCKLRQLHRRDS